MPLDKSEILMLLFDTMKAVHIPLNELKSVLSRFDCLSGTEYNLRKYDSEGKPERLKSSNKGKYLYEDDQLKVDFNEGSEPTVVDTKKSSSIYKRFLEIASPGMPGTCKDLVVFKEDKRDLGRVLSLVTGEYGASRITKNDIPKIKSVFGSNKYKISLQDYHSFIKYLQKLIQFVGRNPDKKEEVVNDVIPLIASALNNDQAKFVLGDEEYRNNLSFFSDETTDILNSKINV
jgi:hypothetical protein